MGVGGLAPEQFLRQGPLERRKRLFAEWNVICFFIGHHTKMEKRIPHRNYNDASFLLLHALTLMIEAKQSRTSSRGKDSA